MFEKVVAIMKDQLSLDVEIKPESKFKDDLGIDSLDLYELAMTIEEETGIELSSDALESMECVQDVVSFLEANA